MSMKPTIPLNQVYAMYEYYSQGHSAVQTARKFGISAPTVREAFRREGLHVRNHTHAMNLVHFIDRDETAAMFSDHKAGMSHDAIARKYHFTRRAIGYRFERLGYTKREVSDGA
jgi:hypothetical protein